MAVYSEFIKHTPALWVGWSGIVIGIIGIIFSVLVWDSVAVSLGFLAIALGISDLFSTDKYLGWFSMIMGMLAVVIPFA